jgi:hypothetical protein
MGRGAVLLKNLDVPEAKDCAFCNAEFARPYALSLVNWLNQRFCSRRCAVYYRRNGNRSLEERGEEMASSAAVASRQHLKLLIQYGLNHNKDLGMGRESFMARARELGMVA